jgi:hypothetical protein
VVGCLEALLIIFALPREIERYRETEAQKALWREDYPNAYKRYYQLLRHDPSNVSYLKALGDAMLGRGQYSSALDYYSRATAKTFSGADVKIQVARAYNALAGMEKDPKKRTEYAEASQKVLQMAHQEAPTDLKVNYWMGEFVLRYGDLVDAAEFFSRVRADALPKGWKPNEEQARLIADAQKALARIQTAVFKDKDYRLDLTGLTITSTPTLAAARPPAPAPPPTTAPVIVPPKPPAPTTAAATVAPSEEIPESPRPTPATAPATPPSAPLPTPEAAGARPPVSTPAPPPKPTPVVQTSPTTVRVPIVPTTGTAPAKP